MRVNIELSLASKAVWNSFEERFGVDIGLRKTAICFSCGPTRPRCGSARTSTYSASLARRANCSRPRRQPSTVRDSIPPFVAATYNPDDGIADPNLAVQGYPEAARKCGVDIRMKAAVTALHREVDRVVVADIRAVGADETERHEVDYVVNVAGAWAATIGEMTGVDLLIAPRRR